MSEGVVGVRGGGGGGGGIAGDDGGCSESSGISEGGGGGSEVLGKFRGHGNNRLCNLNRIDNFLGILTLHN